MGYYVYPFVVDVDAVRAVVGSGDEELVAKILKKQKAEIADNAESFADEIEAGAPRVEQYGYALELLCRHLGKELGAPDPTRGSRPSRRWARC